MRKLLDYYPLAMAEGEGAGTAYEYYAKARAINKVLQKTGTPKNLLIAGIPERYGLSLDFLLLAQELKCKKVLVMDDRPERLEFLKETCCKLTEQNELNCLDILETQPQLYPDAGLPDFDMFISCEVVQRLSEPDQQRYWKSCFQVAKTGIVFTPNAENPSHATHSGLKTVSLQKLKDQATSAGGEVIASGYLDMPPFPPGITRSDDQRESAGQGLFYKLAFAGIQQWANLENCFPLKTRRKSAHIVFVAATKNG